MENLVRGREEWGRSFGHTNHENGHRAGEGASVGGAWKSLAWGAGVGSFRDGLKLEHTGWQAGLGYRC